MDPDRILIVDDNEDLLDNLRDVLEMDGFAVSTASSGEEAILLARDQAFDLVLMDVKMPGMNGVECFIEIKKRHPGIPVIMMTAYSMQDLIARAWEEGAQAVLSKPLEISGLLDTIRAVRKSGEGSLILVAEDDRDLGGNLAHILRQEGYRVMSAYDGEEAVKSIEAHPVDILLLDMKLPSLNGLEVYRRVRKIRPEVVAVLISGYARQMNDMIGQALAEHAHAFLEKPLDMVTLLRTLKGIGGPDRGLLKEGKDLP